MAQQLINVGLVADDGTGDKLRDAFIKSNENFTELYGGGSSLALTDLSVTTSAASGGGTLTYDNTSGVFTFAPADLFRDVNFFISMCFLYIFLKIFL